MEGECGSEMENGGVLSQESTVINLRPSDGGADSELVDLSGKVHQLPCAIKYDGPCSVSHYFKPKSTGIEVDGLEVEEAYFRGRKLQGTTIQLPKGYCGFVLGKKNLVKRKASEMSEGNSNCWDANAKFKNLTYWNHDSLPSCDDAFLRSFHWLAVAKALHKPVTAEDMVSASIALQKMD
ncbi:Ribonuclease H2 subunit C [Morella rubra]|uniref:Ribonuclease H2 subunit C n=1 Tax=Morella rubra TaxID=262757 RepID=A0A6A1WCY5_9ROSI|nr:Ribonuclease H2 subunit C [Morella rubra]